MHRGGQSVVVLGGGYAGVRAALDLDRLLPEDWKIILVDKGVGHNVHALLYEVATMSLKDESKARLNREYANAVIPFFDLFLGTRIEWVHGCVTEIGLDENTVSVKLADDDHSHHFGVEGSVVSMNYEYLIVALGSETNYFNIPGLEGAYGLKSADEAFNIRSAIYEAIEGVAQENGDVHIVVGGGGFTGVEFAGELVGFVRKRARAKGISDERVHISVVEGGSSVLPHAPKWIQEVASNRLSRLGVQLLTENTVVSYNDDKLTLSGNKVIRADILVWAAGIRSSSVLEQSENMPMEKGCVVIDQHLRVGGRSRVYAAGDNIYCTYEDERHLPVPATAQRAVVTGSLAAENIAATIERRKLVSYVPKKPIWFIPIGGKFAVVDTGRFRLKGVSAWGLKMLFQLWYLSSILSLFGALPIWFKSVRTYTRNDI